MTIFLKNFREIRFYTADFVKSINSLVTCHSVHCSQCGNLEIFPHFLRQIDIHFKKSLLKKLIWRNFCRKNVREHSEISSLWVLKLPEILSHTAHCTFLTKISWKQRFYQRSYKIVHFTKYFRRKKEFFVFPRCFH